MTEHDRRLDPELTSRLGPIVASHGLTLAIDEENSFEGTVVLRFVDDDGHALGVVAMVGEVGEDQMSTIHLHGFDERQVGAWHVSVLVSIDAVGSPAGYGTPETFVEALDLAIGTNRSDIDRTWNVTEDSMVLTHPLALRAVDALSEEAGITMQPWWRSSDDEGILVRDEGGREVVLSFGAGLARVASSTYLETVWNRGEFPNFGPNLVSAIRKALQPVPTATP